MFTFETKESKESCILGDNCCSPKPKGKMECPRCKEKAKGVLGKTVVHLVKGGSKSKFDGFDGFYYCKTPSCKVIYFRGDIVLTQDDIKVTVGLKEEATPATLCYCFEWTREKIRAEIEATGKSTVLEDIKANMKNPGCSCEVLNPSGGCCLGDVGKAISQIV